MIDLCKLIWCAFARLFRSRAELEAEILVVPTAKSKRLTSARESVDTSFR